MPGFSKSPRKLAARFDELALLAYDDAVDEWVRRSRAHAERLPAKKPARKG
jgi:hypothetical protein